MQEVVRGALVKDICMKLGAAACMSSDASLEMQCCLVEIGGGGRMALGGSSPALSFTRCVWRVKRGKNGIRMRRGKLGTRGTRGNHNVNVAFPLELKIPECKFDISISRLH